MPQSVFWIIALFLLFGSLKPIYQKIIGNLFWGGFVLVCLAMGILIAFDIIKGFKN